MEVMGGGRRRSDWGKRVKERRRFVKRRKEERMEKVSMFGVFESYFLGYNQLHILVCICIPLISHFISRLLCSKSLFKLIN